MSGTVLEHPLVRDYLRRLDAACAGLPAAAVRELREQITAHLGEALPPGADDEEVQAELARLGPPDALAAETGDPVPLPVAVRFVRRLARLGWRTWAAIAVVLALLAGAGTYAIQVTSAAPLNLGGSQTWLFPQDRARSGETTAGDLNQWTTPERFGQQQGFVVGLWNDSDWTQTIVGLQPGWRLDGMAETIAVGAGPQADEGGTGDDQTRWSLPAAIPPHAFRVLRVLWTSRFCLQTNAYTYFDTLGLRVRVGIITRSEVVSLNSVWELTGTKTSSPAKHCST